jgi:hypothetical protein
MKTLGWLTVIATIGFASWANAEDAGDTAPREAISNSALPTIEAYAIHEQQRRAAINRQLGTIEDMRWQAGLPPLWHGAVPYRRVPSLDELYATGWHGFWYQPSPQMTGGPGIFEPWPVVPGDLWGYRQVDTVRQPLGQIQVQTGPNRWESRPIYAEEWLQPKAASPVDSPAHAAPPQPIHGEPSRRGPREF